MKDCKKILKYFTKHVKLVSLISDAIYNQERYACNSSFVVIEFKPPCKKACKEINKFIRQTDDFLKIDNRFCIIKYLFTDLSSAFKAFENLKVKVLDKNKSKYRYYIYSIDNNNQLTTAEIIKLLAEKICESKFVIPSVKT